MSTLENKSLEPAGWFDFSEVVSPPEAPVAEEIDAEGSAGWVQFPAFQDRAAWNFAKELDIKDHTNCLTRAEGVAAKQLRALASYLATQRADFKDQDGDPEIDYASRIRCLSAVHRLGIAVALANRVRNYLRVGYNDSRAFLYLENPLAYRTVAFPLIQRAEKVRLFCMHLIDLVCELDLLPARFVEDWRRRFWAFKDRDLAWPGFNSFVRTLQEDPFLKDIETMDPEASLEESLRSKMLHRVFRPLARDFRHVASRDCYASNREGVLRTLLALVGRPDINDVAPQLRTLLSQLKRGEPKKDSCVLL